MVEGEGWHPGVIGIAASRLAEQYGLPVVLVSWEGELGRGSARSIPGFDLYQALYACQDKLDKFGGHAMAAGLSLQRSQLDAFRQMLQEQTVQTGPETVIYLDGEISSHQITMELVRELEVLSPFGEGNPVPLFLINHDRIERASLMGANSSHFRAVLQPGNLPVISFRRAEWIEYPFRQCRFNLLAHLDINTYQGNSQVQVKAAHLEPSYKNTALGHDNQLQDILERAVSTLRCGKPVVFVFPTYRVLRYYYKLLSTLLLPEAMCPLHGHLSPQERSTAEEALGRGQPLIYMLTESYCQYLSKGPGQPLKESFRMIRFWLSLPGPVEDNQSCCYPGAKAQPEIRLTRNLNSSMEHTLLYLNSQASNNKLAPQWSQLAASVRISDWTCSELLFDPKSAQVHRQATLDRSQTVNQVVLVDPPYSCYEAMIAARQLTAGSPAVLQAGFTLEQLTALGSQLQHWYPERSIIAKTAAYLARTARNGYIRNDLKSLTAGASQSTGLSLSEQQVLGSLRTLVDLGLCLYRKKGSIIEIKMLVSTSTTLDLADSPYYREGQMEKRAFDKWEQWVKEQLAW